MPVNIFEDFLEMKTGQRPKYRELLADPEQPTGVAWKVFSANPYRGTLNMITRERTVAASKCVQKGVVFSLNWEITKPDPGLFHRKVCRHVFLEDADSTDDYLDGFYLQGSSQWDALSHVYHPQRGHYLGLGKIKSPSENPIGVDRLASQGIVGRGVLVDIARHLETEGRRLQPISCDPISLADFKAALARQQVQLQEGDILAFRTGWLSSWRTIPEFRHEVARQPRIPGLSGAADFAEFLWDIGIAALVCDNPTVEVFPFESQTDNLHHRLIVNLGMPLGEMFDLDALAADCDQDRRYEFFFSAAPLNLPGGSGSPANALGIR
jgi:kynurenine formamidase